MPIITQLNATKLRSLKYGNDTSDGGNSGQPYVKTELKDIDKPFTRFRLTKFDDGLIRGGAIGALNASIVDTIRIGKFLKDFPKGPLFIAKQVGLQLSNPKLETKKGVSGLLGNIGPTRLYNLGINTIAQVPLNAFGGHLMRHGLLPVMDESTKYINVVTENNKNSDNNRLVALTDKFYLGDNEGDISRQFNLQEARRENRENNRAGRQANRAANRQGRQANRLVNQSLKEGAKKEGFEFVRSKFTRTDFKRNKLDTKTLTIDSYNGGPKSVYGIGRTIINRYAFTEDKLKISDAFAESRFQSLRASVSFNPLTTESGFIEDSYEEENGNKIIKWKVGNISTPISPSFPLNNIKETDQFKALGRKPGTKFFYGTDSGSLESKLQNDISDGRISIIEPVSSEPTINPKTNIPFDKFSVIKLLPEDTEYIGGYRRIKIQDDTPGGASIGQAGDQVPMTKTFTGKTQAEVDAQLATGSLFLNPRTLDEVVVSSGKPGRSKTVKASIVNVSNMEGGLEIFYKNGEMVSTPDAESYKLADVSVNRGSKSGFYFNGNRVVPQFDRDDRDILLVSFTPINPFDATDLGNVVMLAYMSGFKYNSNSTWNPIKYVGRSESFYTFTEHKRDVSFNLQIPCFNPTELREKHRGLGELLAIGAGAYSNTSNRLGGVITKITLGRYLVEEPGILTSVSFDIPDVSSWDLDYKLAMYINAQFSFTMIGKDLPTYGIPTKQEPTKGKGGFFKNVPDAINGYLGGTSAI